MKYTICSHAVDFYTYPDCTRVDVVSFKYEIRKKRVKFSVGHYGCGTEEAYLEEAKSMLPEVARKILELNCVVEVK